MSVKSKNKFRSGGGFILAGVGAAVGLGNVLRFPGLCAEYGGGAFILIYSLGLALFGIPLLCAELALGRKYGAAPYSIGRRTGWAQCVNSAVTAVIYAGLIGWILTEAVYIAPLATSDGTKSGISGYFFNEVLKARQDGVITSISPVVCLFVAVGWVAIFLCSAGGADRLSGAARFTVIIPVFMLILLAARGLCYINAGEALRALFIPDFTKLCRADIWISALGQVFFSLSVSVGIMPAYGACLPEGTPVFPCSLIIAAADFFVSVLASVVMFTTLYGCGLQGEIEGAGLITAFAVYPVAICRLFPAYPALNAAAGILFYLSLALIAVQSAVSMSEAFISPMSERFKRIKISALFCAVGAVICLVFATSAGVAALTAGDKFIIFYNVLILSLAECLILKKRDICGLNAEINRFCGKVKMKKSVLVLSIKYLCPIMLFALAALQTFKLSVGNPTVTEIAFGWLPTLFVFAAGICLGLRTKRRGSI